MSTSAPTDPQTLQAHLQIDTPLGSFLGAQRIALLEAIDRHGSIAQAARAIGLSYKAAWDAVDDMNNLSVEALMHRASGGVRGGSTTLTAYGHRLIAFYRALEAEHQDALVRLRPALDQAQADDMTQFQQLLRRFSMQTSARNQFVGQVRQIHADPVEALVELALTPELRLAAVVTTESIERMGLRAGLEVHAVVKSSSVMLALPGAEAMSARNRYLGRVLRIVRGAVNAEVILQLEGDHLQLAAVITDDSVTRLNLAVGMAVTAFFKASSVMLVMCA